MLGTVKNKTQKPITIFNQMLLKLSFIPENEINEKACCYTVIPEQF